MGKCEPIRTGHLPMWKAIRTKKKAKGDRLTGVFYSEDGGKSKRQKPSAKTRPSMLH